MKLADWLGHDATITKTRAEWGVAYTYMARSMAPSWPLVKGGLNALGIYLLYVVALGWWRNRDAPRGRPE